MKQTFLIKLSGEAMSGSKDGGLDFDYIEKICLKIKECHDLGVGIGIVCGGGNFMRGRDAHVMDRITADYTGMLATIMNSLVLKDTFTRLGVPVYNQTGLSVKTIDDIDADKALAAIDDIFVTVDNCSGLDICCIGSSRRLGQSKCADSALCSPGEIFLLEFLRAVLEDRHVGHVLDGDQLCSGSVLPGEFLDNDGFFHNTHFKTAPSIKI